MNIKYKVVAQAQPGVKGGGQVKYYARICRTNRIELDDVALYIRHMSTYSKADFIGAVYRIA